MSVSVYIVTGLCIINVTLWIVFSVKFNKRFSTKSVIEKTRQEMNQLLSELQKNTAYNIDLLNAQADSLRALGTETEKKIEQLNKKIQLLYTESQKVEGARQVQETVRQAVKKDTGTYTVPHGNRAYINPDSTFKINKPAQKDLFEERIEVRDEITLTQDGAAYREVPVITSRMVDEPVVKPVKNSKDKKALQVVDLFRSGHSVKEITQELNLSEIEVQLILDMNS